MAEVSVLPQGMRNKLEQMKAEISPPSVPDTQAAPPAQDEPPAAPPSAAPEAARITLSRDELNDLRAAADASRGVSARLEEAEERNAALLARLTELETSNKAKPVDPPPAADAGFSIASDVTFSEDEVKEYGDSRGFIEKVVTQKVSEILNPILNKIGGSIAETRNAAGTVQASLEQQQQANFANALTKEAPDFRELIRNKYWPQFLLETDALSGFRMEELLAKHIADKNAVQAGKIYKAFAAKYVVDNDTSSAYAGAIQDAGATALPPQPQPTQKLRISDRKKANRDYIDKKITWEKLQEVTKAFEAAEKAGNIDYNS